MKHVCRSSNDWRWESEKEREEDLSVQLQPQLLKSEVFSEQRLRGESLGPGGKEKIRAPTERQCQTDRPQMMCKGGNPRLIFVLLSCCCCCSFCNHWHHFSMMMMLRLLLMMLMRLWQRRRPKSDWHLSQSVSSARESICNFT